MYERYFVKKTLTLNVVCSAKYPWLKEKSSYSVTKCLLTYCLTLWCAGTHSRLLFVGNSVRSSAVVLSTTDEIRTKRKVKDVGSIIVITTTTIFITQEYDTATVSGTKTVIMMMSRSTPRYL